MTEGLPSKRVVARSTTWLSLVSRGTVVLAGSLAEQPHRGGHTWVFLHYLLGFRKLGFRVLFVDRVTSEVAAQDARMAFVAAVMDRFDLASDYCLLDMECTPIAGITRQEALSRTRDSMLLINVNGYLDDAELLAAAPKRVYLDIDPGFPQMWHELGLHDSFAGHDVFVTIAENIGNPECRIPTCGREWITTRQPVVLDLWPVQTAKRDVITSVGAWRGPFAPIEYKGRTYGLRVHEFRKFAKLPALTGGQFELALDIHAAETADLDLLSRNGWRLVQPQTVARDPVAYRNYLGRSRAEFMVAKNMYVDTRGGWFSDRSACYLASGTPVIAQDTGLADRYPTGEGLLAYSTLDEAVSAVETLGSDYARHARAAREIAEAAFDSDKVLTSLLDRIGSSAHV